MPNLKLPRAKNDSGEISTILYTVTIAISIALLLYVINPVSPDLEKSLGNDWMKVTAAACLTISCMLLYHCIDSLADVVTFRYFFPADLKQIKRKYKMTLIFYNISIILIITSVLLLVLQYMLVKFPQHTYVWITIVSVWAVSIFKLADDIRVVVPGDVD